MKWIEEVFMNGLKRESRGIYAFGKFYQAILEAIKDEE